MFLQGNKEADIELIRSAIGQMTHEYQRNSITDSKIAIIPLHRLYCKDTVRRKLSRFMKNNSYRDGIQVWNKIIMDYNKKETNVLTFNEPNLCLFYRGQSIK